MPLIAAVLAEEIEKIQAAAQAKTLGAFFPNGTIDRIGTNRMVATAWAAAAKTFFSTLANPVTSPATLALAETAFRTTMFGLLVPTPGVNPAGAAALDAGFVAFAAQIALGSPPYVVVPPPGPPGIAGALGLPTPDPVSAALKLATKVFTWALTGTATIPPAAPPPPWS